MKEIGSRRAVVMGERERESEGECEGNWSGCEWSKRV
jgi:hypothetical protein